MGIEPTSSAWEAEVLPLNYTRVVADSMWSKAHSQRRHNTGRCRRGHMTVSPCGLLVLRITPTNSNVFR